MESGASSTIEDSFEADWSTSDNTDDNVVEESLLNGSSEQDQKNSEKINEVEGDEISSSSDDESEQELFEINDSEDSAFGAKGIRKNKMNVLESSSEVTTNEESGDLDVSIPEPSPLNNNKGAIPKTRTSPSPQSLDVISLSSDPESEDLPLPQPLLKQTTLPEILNPKKEVTLQVYNNQKEKVKSLQSECAKTRAAIGRVDVKLLPDNGQLLFKKYNDLEDMLKTARSVLEKMKVPDGAQALPAWEQVKAGIVAVQPKTFGKQAMATYNAQKALTLETLEEIHRSIDSRPPDEYLEKDPKLLKVELMPHQRHALAWLLWRETQHPPGGILADDMGLGKTLTMISLILRKIELKENLDESDSETRKNYKRSEFQGGTLIICPASLIKQWSGEIENRCRRGALSIELYHGTKRETRPKALAKNDVVITTYQVASREHDKDGVLFQIKWNRLILDEGHQIRNVKAQQSVAVCKLKSKHRWVLTGTPVHNKELDMYALFKFLRCSPFDDMMVWRRWVSDKSTGGQDRLHTVISSLMLRRTKQELMDNTPHFKLPEKKWELITVQLKPDEADVYQKVLIFSRTLFVQFLHQKAEKRQDLVDAQNLETNIEGIPNDEYMKMRDRLLKLNRVKEIRQHDILVLLLRLRQICCHANLMRKMLEDGEVGDIADEEYEELNLLEQLNRLDINDDPDNGNVAEGLSRDENVGLKEASKGLLSLSNPCFSEEYQSSKVKKTIDLVRNILSTTDDKVIVVSQFRSLLILIGTHLKQQRFSYVQLDGTVPVPKRMELVNSFNDKKDPIKILLLSLTAGGVGLNLVGANHLILTDLHWNPQLENQAQDRIYRLGQQKPIFVYKIMTADTIEERINKLQEQKLALANNMLTGSKEVLGAKLSLQDLKMLFGLGQPILPA